MLSGSSPANSQEKNVERPRGVRTVDINTSEGTTRDGQEYLWLKPEHVPPVAASIVASVTPMPVLVASSV